MRFKKNNNNNKQKQKIKRVGGGTIMRTQQTDVPSD
jgi:hypothetical protein